MSDPSPPDSQQLESFEYRRADIGEYRIIYRHDAHTLYVVLVGKRDGDEVYKELRRKVR